MLKSCVIGINKSEWLSAKQWAFSACANYVLTEHSIGISIGMRRRLLNACDAAVPIKLLMLIVVSQVRTLPHHSVVIPLLRLRWLKTVSYFPRLRVWWVIITTLYQLMPKSWYQQTVQSSVNKLLLILWLNKLPWQQYDLLKAPLNWA